ncbi:unnamed protein product [Symbiodinium sp. CCMP2592]|nr:unnamed protein product [Symbiodinium sp. CCMP2592]
MNLTTIITDTRTSPFPVAGTVAFNGFSAIGDWVIKLLDGSGNLATSKASLVILRFGLQPCDRIAPAADCFGNGFNRKFALFFNRSLLGTTLSAAETAAQFQADLPAACCVPAASPFMQLQFSNSPPFNGIVSAHGRSPDPDGATLTMTGPVQADGGGLRTVFMPTQGPSLLVVWQPDYGISTSPRLVLKQSSTTLCETRSSKSFWSLAHRSKM